MSNSDPGAPSAPKQKKSHRADSTGEGNVPLRNMAPLIRELIRPYRGWLIIVFIAMLIETAMSIAAPWPLKIIIDNVVGKHKLPEFLAWLRDFSFGEHTMASGRRWRRWRGGHRVDRRGRGLH